LNLYPLTPTKVRRKFILVFYLILAKNSKNAAKFLTGVLIYAIIKYHKIIFCSLKFVTDYISIALFKAVNCFVVLDKVIGI